MVSMVVKRHCMFIYISLTLTSVEIGVVNTNSTLFRVQTSVKFKDISSQNQVVSPLSITECVYHCQSSSCCAANYFVPSKQCYLEYSNCYGEIENLFGWKILRQEIKTIYIDQKKSWADAEAHCVTLGGHLAVVSTPEKHDFIKTFHDGTNSIWVGASDIDQEGYWVWHNPTQPVLLTDWAPGRPDNYADIEHCLIYSDYVGFLWDDRVCTSKEYFICDI